MATHVYQMAINYNVGGQFASNILHFSFDDGGFTTTAGAAVGLCNGWDTANRTRLRNILSTHVTILGYKARAIQTPGGFEGEVLLSASNTGNRTGTLQAAGVGPVSVLYPSGNGTQRGRVFWPGVTDLDAFDGLLTDTYKGVIVTSVAGMISTFPTVGGGAVTVQPVIWSRKLLTAFPIFAAQTSAMIGQVRRRQLPA